MSTLVVGARGAVGRHVVAGLREAEKTVRASVRDRNGFDPPAGVEVVQADLREPATLTAMTTTARDVIGRDPIPFAAWAAEHAAEFR